MPCVRRKHWFSLSIIQARAARRACHEENIYLGTENWGTTMNSRGSSLLLFGMLALGLTSCGPIYDTQYQFIPPESSQGRMCTYHCEESQQQCRRLEEIEADRCNERAEYDRRECERDLWERKQRNPKWYECGGGSCSANYDRCDQMYRSCFESCGGEVRQEVRCVANCDAVPPPPTKNTQNRK